MTGCPSIMKGEMEEWGSNPKGAVCLHLFTLYYCHFCCRLVEDTAWHPIMREEMEEWGSSPKGAIAKFFLGTPLKLWASVGHWALWHFDIHKFTAKQRARVRAAPSTSSHVLRVPVCTSGDHIRQTADTRRFASGPVRCRPHDAGPYAG